MKVYMIDDSVVKQKRFALVLERSNDLLRQQGRSIDLQSGFSLVASEAMKQSQDPESLYNALTDSNECVYLVDFDLNETGEARDGLIEFIRKAQTTWSQSAVKLYEETRKGNSPLSKPLNAYGNSMIFLFAAKELKKRCLMVTNLNISHTKEVFRAGLADRFDAFDDDDNFTTHEAIAEIDRWANRIISYVDRLDYLQAATKNWFAKNIGNDWEGFESDGPPHIYSTEHRKEEYGCVKKVFTWLPSEWYADDSKAEYAHDLLKHSLGKSAEWCSGDTGTYPLPLGGAYLLLMLALPNIEKSEGAVVKDPSSFYLNDSLIPFLPRQGNQDANTSVRCLFEFFMAVFKNEAEKDGNNTPFQYEGLQIDPPNQSSRCLRVKLNWPKASFERFSAKLSEMTNQILRSELLSIQTAQTRGCWLRFVIASQVRSNPSVGALGQIFLAFPYLYLGLFSEEHYDE